VSGFDPRGVAAYHRMYSEESQKQAALSGVSVKVGQRKREGARASTWRVERAADGDTVETTFEFMHWDDITRTHWHAGYARLYGLAFKTYWYWIAASDFLAKLFRISGWNSLPLALRRWRFLSCPCLHCWPAGPAIPGAIRRPEAGWLPALSEQQASPCIALGYWLDRILSLGWLLRTCALSSNTAGESPRA